MADLPFVEVHAPNVRFTKEQIARLEGATGITSTQGLDESGDGTFGAVRITFEDNDVMGKYIAAYETMRKK